MEIISSIVLIFSHPRLKLLNLVLLLSSIEYHKATLCSRLNSPAPLAQKVYLAQIIQWFYFIYMFVVIENCKRKLFAQYSSNQN